MPLCLTLSIIRYISRVKWCNPGKGVAPFPTPWWSRYRKVSQLYISVLMAQHSDDDENKELREEKTWNKRKSKTTKRKIMKPRNTINERHKKKSERKSKLFVSMIRKRIKSKKND